MILYRPVGIKELELIAQLDFRAFPPRLEIQPIFYPVLNFDYAAQIARDWNTKDPVSGFAGFVTRFEIGDAYAATFEVQTVGRRGRHDELWVPAEELAEFNSQIMGKIEVVAAFYGDDFAGVTTFEGHPMNYNANLDTGEKLTLGNDNGHTQIGLSSDKNGRSAAQNTAFPTGNWTQKPQLFGVGIGFVAQFATDDGQKWVSVDQNGIHLLDNAPDLSAAKALELAESKPDEVEPLPAMKPMAPLQPMES